MGRNEFLNDIENDLNEIHNIIFGSAKDKNDLLNAKEDVLEIISYLKFLNENIELANSKLKNMNKIFPIYIKVLQFTLFVLLLMGLLNPLLFILYFSFNYYFLKSDKKYKAKFSEYKNKIIGLLNNANYKAEIIDKKIERLGNDLPHVQSLVTYPTIVSKLNIMPSKLILRKKD